MFLNRRPFVDAQAALPFVVGQGRNIETAIYRRKYPTFNYANIVPVVIEGNPWAIGTLFQMIDYTGQAKIISGAAKDIPFNQVTREQGTRDYFMVGSGWEWNLEEVNQAALYGIPLNSEKSFATDQSVERLLYDIAMSGTNEKNITGFVNDAVVAAADAAASGSGSSTFWTLKTAENILADINDALGLVRSNSLEIEWADTIALPPEAFRLIATRRVGAGDGLITVLEFVRQNNVYTAETGAPLNIIVVRELATASPDGGGRLVVYRRSSEVLRYHLPMPKMVLPAIQDGLMLFHQGVIARTGGVEIRLPAAMLYIDEITDVPA